MTKQYVVLQTYHPTPLLTWHKSAVINLEEEEAIPYIGNILLPLYSAIKQGLYPPKTSSPIEKIAAAINPEPISAVATIPEPTPIPTPNPPAPKKILENELRQKIQAAKAAKKAK